MATPQARDTRPGEGPAPEARRVVLGLVLDYPGVRQVDLARLAHLQPSLTEYHIEALLDAELIVERTVEGQRRFFPMPIPGAPAVADAEWLGILREAVPLRLALALLQAPGSMSHMHLTQTAGLAKSTVSHHLGKMTEVGLVVRDANGYSLADAERVAALLVRHRPVPELMDEHLSAWLRLYQAAARARPQTDPS